MVALRNRRATFAALRKLYLTLQVFEIALLVQSNLRHVLEEITYLEAAELNRDVLIQSGVIREQVIVSHLSNAIMEINVIRTLFLKCGRAPCYDRCIIVPDRSSNKT